MNFLFLTNLSLKAKILAAPVIIIILLAIVTGIAILNLGNIDTNVTEIDKSLGPDAKTASQILQQVYIKRLQAKEFISTSSSQSKDLFNQAEAELQIILNSASTTIVHPERVTLVQKIKKSNLNYTATFSNAVVANMDKRNLIVNNILNVQGPKMRKKLSQVMTSAYSKNNSLIANTASNLVQHLLLARLYVFRYLDTNDQKSIARAETEFNKVTTLYTTLIEQLNDQKANNPQFSFPQADKAPNLQLAIDAKAAFDTYVNGFNNLVTAISERNRAIQHILDVEGPLMAKMANDLRDSVFTSLAKKSEIVHGDVVNTIMFITTTTIFAIIIGLMVSWLVTKGILAPLAQTNTMLQEISQGNGDLTKRICINSNDEIGQLGLKFNHFIETIQGIIKQVVTSSQDVGTAADKVMSITEETSTSIHQQKYEIEQIATAMNQMSATVQSVSKDAAEASTAAQAANKETVNGNDVVSDTIATIHSLAKEVSLSAAIIDKLEDKSSAIGSILDVIKGIAEQTNLLALNAAIEAARAGETGRGFAVVADEVRMLAQRTKDSTSEIESLIQELQLGSQQAVSQIAQSQNMALSTVEQAATADQSLQAISKSVDIISVMNTQIATAANQQSAVAEEINCNLTQIQTVSDQTSLSSDKTAAASGELSKLSEQLNQLVRQFKV